MICNSKFNVDVRKTFSMNIMPNIRILCRIFEYYAEYSNIMPNIRILCRIFEYYAEYSNIMPNIRIFFRILCRIFEYYSEYSNIMPNIRILCRIFEYYSEYSNILPNIMPNIRIYTYAEYSSFNKYFASSSLDSVILEAPYIIVSCYSIIVSY